ncbi:adenylate kinase [Lujinxingia sediminis]|uniref:Adenylate kinase n=1 Tax=Lujinxingia sediminis TaxID=2480984 RepID=A0ABY0CS87_9DELT|nr:adenylate kinase [Lujinxingia sediminis]RVU43126.1 adenylate kinase [Lujinxingia sediminis]
MTFETLYRADGTPYDRYVVVGTSGSGKSTLANRLAWQTSNRHVELDRLHWLPGWQERPWDVFCEDVAAATAGERWVADGNYSVVRDVVWGRAEAVVWLDLPFRQVMSQIVVRTLRRGVTGEVVCNGNVESLARGFMSRESIILWAAKTWKKHRVRNERLLMGQREPAWQHLDVFRVRSGDLRDVEIWRGGVKGRVFSEGVMGLEG